MLKKAQTETEKEIQNTLAAIRMGVITQSTKDMLLQEKEEMLAVKIAKLSKRTPKLIDKNDCADFLFSLTALDFSIPENRKLLFDRFIRRVELGNLKIRIFFNPVDKPYLYAHKEDDLSPPDGYGKDDTTEEQNSSPPQSIRLWMHFARQRRKYRTRVQYFRFSYCLCGCVIVFRYGYERLFAAIETEIDCRSAACR